MNRVLNLALLTLAPLSVQCQQIDSVRIFRELPGGDRTTSWAESAAWRLDRTKALSVGIRGAELEPLVRLMSELDPIEHGHANLPGLTYLGFVYARGGKYAIGVMKDLGIVVNLTVRREYHLPEGPERSGLEELLHKSLD
ncbi:MAG: hypothetical protein IPO90_10305 [Flavobacteriales bacterium]|nr:hypothetical protein [Flavobacteriales bacterium]MBL0045133.1 hypothetical protein [Flavobacteriales bacterium]